jgi:hypothetical protein
VLVGVWQKILDFCDREKKTVTYDMVRDAVAAQRTKTNELVTRARRPAPAKKGIDIDLGDSNGAAAPSTSLWSEEGEKALNRIRRLCGDDIADAIDSKNPQVPERDLLKWAEQETEMVKNLAYWIVHKRWTLRKALAYEENAVNESTTVRELIDFATSRGGRASVQFEEARITVEIAA